MMPLTDDEIRALSPEALNKLLAEMIGLQLEVTHSETYWHSGRYWPDRKVYEPAPNFAGDFNALQAVKPRDGFDGPVAWLQRAFDEGRFSPGMKQMLLNILNWNLGLVVKCGSRVAAEDCAIAGQHVGEEEC